MSSPNPGVLYQSQGDPAIYLAANAIANALGFAAQPLALLVLALGLVWSIWLGTVLLRVPARDRVGHRAV